MDLGETTTELFKHILPRIYPDLDTLEINGMRFGNLLNENLFGENFRHEKLNLVNLSGNSIQTFGQQTFIGLSRVEYLYLNNNELNSLIGSNPFNYLTSLKLIDLSNFFGKHISLKARTDLLKDLFQNNHSFVDLSEIILTRNQLEDLHEDTFCNVRLFF